MIILWTSWQSQQANLKMVQFLIETLCKSISCLYLLIVEEDGDKQLHELIV
jgi:hypothetical protein